MNPIRRKFICCLVLFQTLYCDEGTVTHTRKTERPKEPYCNSCAYIFVNPGEVGLINDRYSGTVHREIYTEGRHAVSYLGDLISYSIQPKNYEEQLEVLTRDDLKVGVKASIRITLVKTQIYRLHTEIGSDYYSNIIGQDFRGAIKNVFKEYPMTQISKNYENIEKEIKSILAAKSSAIFFEIEGISIEGISYDQVITDAIQNKLVKEQEVDSMKYEISSAKKRNEIDKMNAVQDAEIKIIQAKAEAESLRIVNKHITTKYIQLKAMENPNLRVIYLPLGRDGLPLLGDSDQKIENKLPAPYAKYTKSAK